MTKTWFAIAILWIALLLWVSMTFKPIVVLLCTVYFFAGMVIGRLRS